MLLFLREKTRVSARPSVKAEEQRQLRNLSHIFQYYIKNVITLPDLRIAKAQMWWGIQLKQDKYGQLRNDFCKSKYLIMECTGYWGEFIFSFCFLVVLFVFFSKCFNFWGKGNANSLFWNYFRAVYALSPFAQLQGHFSCDQMQHHQHSIHTHGGMKQTAPFSWMHMWICFNVRTLSTCSHHECCISEGWRSESFSDRLCLEGFLRRGLGDPALNFTDEPELRQNMNLLTNSDLRLRNIYS